MKKPTYEQGLQLHSNFLDLMKTVDHDGAQRLIQNFNLVHAIASGLVHRIASGEITLQEPNPKPIASGAPIAGVPTVKVADCFKVGDGVYVHRDSDFDKWLPKTFPAVGPGNASMFELTESLNFQEMVEAYLGVNGSIDELKKMLIDKGKCWSPRQIDELIRRCERGDNPLKLRTDGRPHFFFMQVGDDVFAVGAYRYSDVWYVYVRSFEDARRWSVEYRVSFRN